MVIKKIFIPNWLNYWVWMISVGDRAHSQNKNRAIAAF
jgi:hypothetical protein